MCLIHGPAEVMACKFLQENLQIESVTERAPKQTLGPTWARWKQSFLCVLGRDGRAFTPYRGTPKCVEQFSDVARPRIAEEKVFGTSRKLLLLVGRIR